MDKSDKLANGKPKPEGYVFGRPTTYRPEYCQQIIDYFAKPKFHLEDVLIQTKHGEKVVRKLICDYFPTLYGFAASIGVWSQTILDWVKIHSDFNEAYMHAKDLQRDNLSQGGLLEAYNAQITQFIGINDMGMRSSKQDITIDEPTMSDEQREQRIKELIAMRDKKASD